MRCTKSLVDPHDHEGKEKRGFKSSIVNKCTVPAFLASRSLKTQNTGKKGLSVKRVLPQKLGKY